MNARNFERDSRTRECGFTLIELIVVMVVIAILAAIAIPNYQEYVLRSRRGDAQAFLLDVAARQQHFLVDRRAYSESIRKGGAAGGLGMTVPPAVANFYDIGFSNPPDLAENDDATNTVVNNVPGNPPTFTVFAVPRGAQVGDRCGTLGLNQAGARTTSTGATGCW